VSLRPPLIAALGAVAVLVAAIGWVVLRPVSSERAPLPEPITITAPGTAAPVETATEPPVTPASTPVPPPSATDVVPPPPLPDDGDDDDADGVDDDDDDD
jgi:hypothetical protein